MVTTPPPPVIYASDWIETRNCSATHLSELTSMNLPLITISCQRMQNTYKCIYIDFHFNICWQKKMANKAAEKGNFALPNTSAKIAIFYYMMHEHSWIYIYKLKETAILNSIILINDFENTSLFESFSSLNSIYKYFMTSVKRFKHWSTIVCVKLIPLG